MKAAIHVISGTSIKRSFDLTQGSHVIGRESSADIQIPSKEISRQHARITIQDGKAMIEDLKSSNGTLVNGKKITAKALKHKDRIIFGDVIVEFRDEEKFVNQHFEAGKTLYQQATKVMTERLKPRNLWPFFFLCFSIAFFALSWVTYSSFKSLLKEKLTQQSLQNAQNMVRYLAEKNREDLRLLNHLLLDISAVEGEKGVIEALIIGNNGRVLAPAKQLDQTDLGPYVMEALNHPSNDLILPSPRNANGHHTLVHPIRVYDDRQGKYVTLGVAKIVYSTDRSIGSLPETTHLFYFMLFVSLLVSAGLGFIASKALTHPILHLAEKIQRWRTGQIYQGDDPPFKDWEPLYQAVQRAIEDQEK